MSNDQNSGWWVRRFDSCVHAMARKLHVAAVPYAASPDVASNLGGCLVTFTPAQGFVGRAKFDFTVTDREGRAWRQTCALLVREP